jgi:peptidoglycan hydrolase-like protein with peptidoglycan-binding domain
MQVVVTSRSIERGTNVVAENELEGIVMKLEISFDPLPFPWLPELELEDEESRSSPDYIRRVQSSLNRVMGLRLAVDGILGSATRSAIRSFQQRHGLTVDGIVGPQTEAKLKSLTDARSWGGMPVSTQPWGPPVSARSSGGAPMSARSSGGAPVSASAAPAMLPSPCGNPSPLPCRQLTIIDHFGEGKTVPEPGHQPNYDAVISGLAACVGGRLRGFLAYGVIRITGHTSGEGSVEYNRALAQGRADQVTKDLQTALLAQGLAVTTFYLVPIDGVVILQAETAGETKLRVNPERGENDRKLNRRVEIDLSGLVRKPPGPAPAPAKMHELIKVVKETIGFLPLQKQGIKLPATARFLDPAEQAEAMTIYGGSLDFSKILITDGIGAADASGNPRPYTLAVTLGGVWYVALMMGDIDCWATKPRSVTLIHELAHAWQSQHHGTDHIAYIKNSLKCQALATAATKADPRGRTFNEYAYVNGLPFGEYSAEQIAQQVQNLYKPSRTGCPTSALLTTIRAASPNAPVKENQASLTVVDARPWPASGVCR